MGSSGEANAVSKGEAMRPAAQLFHAPTLNCYVIASLGSKTRINPRVVKEGLRHTLLKNPRFTSKLILYNNFSYTPRIKPFHILSLFFVSKPFPLFLFLRSLLLVAFVGDENRALHIQDSNLLLWTLGL
ncbi:hypothetical protein K1719_011296 [Acacia pycnantha]|nr:hypothetical protein K1719_011296 [Acacia pycnantha]